MLRSIGLLFPAGLLAACSPAPDSQADAGDAPDVAVGEELIDCALDGATEYAKVCAVDREHADGTLYLTVRHPDGGFRRFGVLSDGRGLEPADGAEPAYLRMSGELLEVQIGPDRYRFPATRKTNASGS